MIPSSRRSWLVLVVPGGVALALRAAAAWLRPPWHDEYFTAWASQLSWGDLLAALRMDSGPPLLYVLTHAVSALGIPPLAAARSLAVLSGVVAVILTVTAARRLWGNEAAWVAGLLLACHPLAVHWGSEGRAYGLLLAASAWGWERLGRVSQRSSTASADMATLAGVLGNRSLGRTDSTPGALTTGCAHSDGDLRPLVTNPGEQYGLGRLGQEGRGAVGLGLAVGLACWSHSLGLVLAGALGASTLFLPATNHRKAMLAVALGLASHLPWIPVMAAQPPAAIAWMTSLWDSLPIPPSRVLAIVRYLSPIAAFGGVMDLPSPPLGLELAGAAVALSLLAGALRARRFPASPVTGVALPVIGFWGLATLGVPIVFPGRTQVVFLIPLLLLLATPVGRLARAGGLALAGGGLLVSAVALLAWSGEPPGTEALVAKNLRRHLPDSGTVVVGGIWRLGLWYHLGDPRSDITLVSFPAAAGAHPGWYVPFYDHPAPGELETLAGRLVPRASAVVVTPGIDSTEALRRLAVHTGLRRAPTLAGAELWVPLLPAAPGAGGSSP